MTELAPLITILTNVLGWHRARITFLAQFLVAVIRVRTVNLTDIATAFCGDARPASSYRRIQRFLKDFDLDLSRIATLVVHLLPLGQQGVLCLDRTNWKFGAVNINFLVLAVAYHGIAVPLFWIILDKRGNSHTTERLVLLKRFLKHFGPDRIQCVTADREFIGGRWIRFLKKHHIPFRIRIRHNTRIPNTRGTGCCSASAYFRNLPVGTMGILPQPRLVWGLSVYVVGGRLKQEYLILITDAAPETALADYKKRWEIETLFACFKSHGFQFEATHLIHHDRLSKLCALLTLAFCWCYRVGIWRHDCKPIPVKTHGRRAKSLFRHGLDMVRNIVLNLAVKEREFSWVVKFLSCT